MPTIALTTGTSSRSRASLALRVRSPRDTPLPLPTNVLLLRWDTKPASASGGRSYALHRHAERLSMPQSARTQRHVELGAAGCTVLIRRTRDGDLVVENVVRDVACSPVDRHPLPP